MITLDPGNISDYISDSEVEESLPGAIRALDSLVNRKGRGSEMLGWLDLPSVPAESTGRLEEEGERVREECDCLVVTGIGGSYLGARAAIEALCEEAEFPVYFAGNNLSSLYHSRLLHKLQDRRFAVCVISKSGTTTETAIAFRLLKELIREQDDPRSSERIIAITDPRKGALRKLAEEIGITVFDIPRDVGGRFSILSPVGLLPCAVAGIPVEEMLEGAADALEEYTRKADSNIMLLYALTRHLLQAKGIAVEVLSTFQPEMNQFCEWWKQLAGESEGKEGGGLFPASTVMTTDLHSLGQLLQEGRRNILETFLISNKPCRELIVPEEEENLDNLNYLAGKSLGQINRKAYEGTRDAHISGKIPVLSLEIPSITPRAMGELFIFFELAVSVSGRMAGINPFDQPGVEEYKKRMFRLLEKPGV
ncbi:MAG: glucose-6-phosphate isomerase [Candidatus Latescibacteria bacterium]|nr:glucose-6-phosphate isomerase [bacterium]MBD3423870.1 glucose-6-phosphate isomerase [Candidatus Latescibacterota bacterium]